MRSGLLDRILQALYEDLIERGQVKLDEWFIDGSFVPAKGGALVSHGARGKGSKIMAVADSHGQHDALHLAAAAPHEVTLVHNTLDAAFGLDHPARLIGDTAYDSDLLDEQLAEQGTFDDCQEPQEPHQDAGWKAAASSEAAVPDRAVVLVVAAVPAGGGVVRAFR